MPKVKINESQRKDIRANLNTINQSFLPLHNEALQLKEKLKNHMTILMDLRIFYNKYGTPDMAKQLNKLLNTVWGTLDKFDDKLYDIKGDLMTLRNHDFGAVIDAFDEYEKFCKK